jgi:hypothetical protein
VAGGQRNDPFRGENAGETLSAIYRAKSGALRKLTNHPTNLIEFSPDALGHTIVYAAEKPKPKVLTDQSAREGVVVANEDMSELLMGVRTDEIRDLFLLDTRTGQSHPLPISPGLQVLPRRKHLQFSRP